MRNRNTNVYGSSFGTSTVDLVWEKGIKVPNNDPNVFRKDMCGHWIMRSAHGDINSQYGWEIDHKIPVAKGGTDDISNLQPLYWETNRDKSDTYPWSCPGKII